MTPATSIDPPTRPATGTPASSTWDAPSTDLAFRIGVSIVLAAIYLLFINRFSMDLNGERYFVLSDDQMISMRYARNFAAGLGPVWNPGERVEGFTNPLWTAYMAMWHLFDVPRSKISLPIILTSGVILILNALVVYAIAGKLSPNSRSVPRVAMVLAGTYWSLVHWSLDGFEVGLTAVLTSVVALHAFEYEESQRTRQLIVMAGCLIALGWTRLEMLAVAGVPVGYLILTEPTRARIIALVGGPVAASLVLLFGARLWYYGEWLPNTYYLKLTGLAMRDRVLMGLHKAGTTLLTHYSFVIAPIVLIPFNFARHRRVIVLLTMWAVGIAYTIYIGGDTWERPYHANRFLAAITPLLCCVALSLTYEYRVPRHARIAPVVIAVLGILMATGLSGRNFRAWLLADLQRSQIFKQVALGEMLREQASPDARIAVVWAGAAPYFSDLYAIDLLGKSDKFIARTPPHNMSLGHNKWDYAHSIGKLKPDYVLEVWDPSPENRAYVTGLGYSEMPNGIFVRSR